MDKNNKVSKEFMKKLDEAEKAILNNGSLMASLKKLAKM
jgi:hypothetical protein